MGKNLEMNHETAQVPNQTLADDHESTSCSEGTTVKLTLVIFVDCFSKILLLKLQD